MAKDGITTTVVTGKVRFSYAHVFQPTAIDEGAEKKYNTQILKIGRAHV